MISFITLFYNDKGFVLFTIVRSGYEKFVLIAKVPTKQNVVKKPTEKANF